jgi:hypothetical protein
MKFPLALVLIGILISCSEKEPNKDINNDSIEGKYSGIVQISKTYTKKYPTHPVSNKVVNSSEIKTVEITIDGTILKLNGNTMTGGPITFFLQNDGTYEFDTERKIIKYSSNTGYDEQVKGEGAGASSTFPMTVEDKRNGELKK